MHGFQLWMDRLSLVTRVCCYFDRHLSKRHDSTYVQYIKQKQSSGYRTRQRTILGYTSPFSPAVDSQTTHSSSNPTQNSVTNWLVKDLVVSYGLPLSLIDDKCFRHFLTVVDPKYVPPCRKTVTYFLISKTVHIVQSTLRHKLESSSDIGLTGMLMYS